MANTHQLLWQVQARAELERRRRQSRVKIADWRDWTRILFKDIFTNPFGEHHKEYWRWLDAIERNKKPKAFFAIWPRGGGKTTNAEMGTVYVGAVGKRKFCLYVRATQNKANESVANISAALESTMVANYYPALSERKLGKYGYSRGWRVDMLRCSNGFTVVGLGLDASVRGIKIEMDRPDLIILDDIDDKRDTNLAIEKKISTITNDILPAGSSDVAVIGVQNLMHYDSIFSLISRNEAGFLYDRIVSGPYPAINSFAYQQNPDGGYDIVNGESIWGGQSLSICQSQINEWGLTAFLQEAQQDVQKQLGGMFSNLHFQHCQWSEVPELVDGCIWIDPAVTTTDNSDSMAIQADGLGIDDKIYRLFSWEQITTPLEVLKRAILKAIELKFDRVGVETDQGGDLWQDEYNMACGELINDDDYPHINDSTELPDFESNKAGAGYGPKVHRWGLMLSDYERGRFVHVIGTHDVLEKALNRVPKFKPYDLVDAAFWSWDDLANNSVYVGSIQVRI